MLLNKGSDERDMTPFLVENIVMMVYEGPPTPLPSRRHHVSSLSPRAPTHYCWGHNGVTAQVFHYHNKYIYIKVCFTAVPMGKIKKKAEERRGR
jgi:hypothetical protein